MKYCLVGLAVMSMAIPAAAQSSNEEPLLIAPQQAQPNDVQYLPANTEVVLAVNETLTSKGKAFNEGDTFGLTVQYPVYLDDMIVIPKGARATGRITWMTGKGAFGKSGKMEIDVEYVDVNGRRIPLEGHFRQEGEGNTVATVGGVIAVGVFAGFITGKSAVIPRGRELTVHTTDDLPVRLARATPLPFATQPGSRLAVATAAPASRGASAKPANEWGLEPVGAN